MYRTPEQDERLNELYKERDVICDYAQEHNVSVVLALKAIDDEIEFLTAGIGEMVCQKCAAKSLVDDPERITEAVEMAFDHDPRTPDEKALDEWQAEADDLRSMLL